MRSTIFVVLLKLVAIRNPHGRRTTLGQTGLFLYKRGSKN